jgi:hypothetical protein
VSALYETDFYRWTQEQARHLRRAADLRVNATTEIDWLELAEEIEDLGKSLERELYSRLSVLLAHLLKWQIQPSLRGNSWALTIAHQRFELGRLLRKNPGLKAKIAGEFGDAYRAARLLAARETGFDLELLPEHCPFTRAQVLDESFLPEGER